MVIEPQRVNASMGDVSQNIDDSWDLRPTRALAISVAEAPSITTRQWFSRHVDAKDWGLCCLRCVVSALGLHPREDTHDTGAVR